MPGWPGPVLVAAGGVLALAALAMAALAPPDRPALPAAWLGAGLLVGALAFVVGLVYAAIRQIRVRSVLPPERYRGPSVFILLALAWVAGAVLTLPFTSDALILQGGDGDLSPLGPAVLLVAAQVGLLAVAYLFVYRPRALAGLPGLPGRGPARAMLIGLGWGALAWIGSNVVLLLWAVILTALGLPPSPTPAQQAIALVDPWLVVIAFVIFAPIAEELFFRGIVFNAWLREAGRTWAYVGSAALFAALHLSLLTSVPIFLLGLALAWVYERGGNLAAPIAMHATVNGITVAAALAVRYGLIDLPTAIMVW